MSEDFKSFTEEEWEELTVLAEKVLACNVPWRRAEAETDFRTNLPDKFRVKLSPKLQDTLFGAMLGDSDAPDIGLSPARQMRIERCTKDPFYAVQVLHGAEISDFLVKAAKKAYFKVLQYSQKQFAKLEDRRAAAREASYEKVGSLLSSVENLKPFGRVFNASFARDLKPFEDVLHLRHFNEYERGLYKNTNRHGKYVTEQVHPTRIASGPTAGFAKEAAAAAPRNTSATSTGAAERRTVTRRTGRAFRNDTDGTKPDGNEPG